MIQVKVTWSNHCGTEPQWARVLCLGPPYTESFHSSTQPDPLSSPRASPRVRTPSTILYFYGQHYWAPTYYVCTHSHINICTQKRNLHNIHFQLCTASHTLTSPIYICTPHLPNIATLAPDRGATTATKVTCLFAILFIFFALVYLWFFILAHISSLEFAWNPSESFYCLFVFWSFCLSAYLSYCLSVFNTVFLSYYHSVIVSLCFLSLCLSIFSSSHFISIFRNSPGSLLSPFYSIFVFLS